MVNRRYAFNLRLAPLLCLFFIMLLWFAAMAYTIFLLDHPTFYEILRHFFSIEQGGIHYRVFIFFFPPFATFAAYLIVVKDRHLDDLKKKKKELGRTNAELEILLKQNNQFILRLGHDLKTPITPLVTLLPLIREQEKDEKLRMLLDALIVNVSALKELVIKSLKLARVKSSRDIQLEEIGLKKEVNLYIEKRAPMLKKHGYEVEIEIDDNLTVMADKLDLEELFNNLISNAVKYSNSSSPIRIKADESKQYVTISVIDKGIGLSGEQAEQIFEEFYKADESRHELDSSGLGLSICKHIIRCHGGSIHAVSEGIGKGTEVIFTLPNNPLESENDNE